LEKVYADMQFLQAICKSNRDFVNLLRSPVVKADKKNSILTAITTGKVTAITEGFNKLLIAKGRESDLPEIVNAIIDQYNTIKGIHKVKLTTAVAIGDGLKNTIVDKVKQGSGIDSIELETKTDESLIGGFVLEFNNNLVDASVLRDLKDIKKQFIGNVYIRNIR
jgi:F-type H+-transporting ATPase subunit delta